MERIEFEKVDENYNSEIVTGITANGKVVMIADPYYASPLHEGICRAINEYHKELEDGIEFDYSQFSTEFHNDADTVAECLLSALRCAKAKQHELYEAYVKEVNARKE